MQKADSQSEANAKEAAPFDAASGDQAMRSRLEPISVNS